MALEQWQPHGTEKTQRQHGSWEATMASSRNKQINCHMGSCKALEKLSCNPIFSHCSESTALAPLGCTRLSCVGTLPLQSNENGFGKVTLAFQYGPAMQLYLCKSGQQILACHIEYTHHLCTWSTLGPCVASLQWHQ